MSSLHLLVLILFPFATSSITQDIDSSFTVIGTSGVPAMHAALMPNGKVLFLDKIENYTELRLPNSRPAYSSLFDPDTASLTPLPIKTNPFCCGGAFLEDGRLMTVGGNGPLTWLDPTVGDGFDAVRYLDLTATQWIESDTGSLNGLDIRDTRNNNPTYEILSEKGHNFGKSYPMDILVKNQPYWMYPFLHLLPDGTLFVFVSKSSQIFNVEKSSIVKTLPDLPGMHRTYPNTGGSIMLPLSREDNYTLRIMVCGGGMTDQPTSPTDSSCGIIQPFARHPCWKMTMMPGGGRGMVEAVNLLDRTVLWLNGAHQGCQGFGTAKYPSFQALIYHPNSNTWNNAGKSKIPRMYHSVALMLLDGTILIAGSNPNEMPILAQDIDPNNPLKAFATEFRVERYIPPYLIGVRAADRPKITWIERVRLSRDQSTFAIRYQALHDPSHVELILYHGGFVTHALHMGQIMVVLENDGWIDKGNGIKETHVRLPEFSLAPGPYIIYVMADGIPSIGRFVSLLL